MPDLVFPADPAYALSRNRFIGRPDEVLPRAVARCADVEDVRAALALAREEGWSFALRSGGHSNAGHSSTTGLSIDLTPLDTVEVHGDRVTIGGGVRSGRLARVLAGHGRLVPLGSCPSVGVVGAALGGGFGCDGREFGLTCDALVAAQVVLADGRVVEASGDDDLFWALRGAGGGHFGVVTAATFAAVPARPRTHLVLEWDFRYASALVSWWQRILPDAPDPVSVELQLVVPEDTDADPVALLVGAVPDRAAVDALVADFGVPPRRSEIVDLDAAQAVVCRPTPHSAAAVDPERDPLTHHRPGMMTCRTAFFADPLPDDATAALLAHLTGEREFGESRELSFTPWRGAYGRVPVAATAFAHRDAAFLLKHSVLLGPGGAQRRGAAVLDRITAGWEIARPHGTGGVYPNFPDPAHADWPTAYHGANLARLRAVKARFDPEEVFRHAQSIRPRVSSR